MKVSTKHVEFIKERVRTMYATRHTTLAEDKQNYELSGCSMTRLCFDLLASSLTNRDMYTLYRHYNDNHLITATKRVIRELLTEGNMSVSIKTWKTSNGKVRATTDQEGGKQYCFTPYDFGLSDRENHVAAFSKLVEKLNWQGDYAMGGTAKGYVFVRVGGKYEVGATRVVNL